MKNNIFIKAAAEIVLAAAIFALMYKDFAAPPIREAEKENAEAVLRPARASHASPPEKEEAQMQAQETISPGQYPIMGKSEVTAEDMALYFIDSGAVYPGDELAAGGAGSLEEFCQIYVDEAKAEGVRAEVAFAQTMKETGWLAFGGDAAIEQFNFAGLGVTGGGVRGNSFPDVRTGVRAQIQHLKAYASTEELNMECVDKRYDLVERGSAPYVEWLGRQENPKGCGWAVSEDYGYSIVEMITDLNNTKFRQKH